MALREMSVKRRTNFDLVRRITGASPYGRLAQPFCSLPGSGKVLAPMGTALALTDVWNG